MNNALYNTLLVVFNQNASDRSLLQFLENWIKTYSVDELIFLYVLPKNIMLGSLQDEEVNKVNQAHIAKVEKELQDFYNYETKLVHRLVVREGDALELILAEERKLKPDLIVIASQKDKVHQIRLMNLVRLSVCSILVIPEIATLQKIERIMVPIDFSPASILAFQMAVRLGIKNDLQTELLLWHAYQHPDFSVYKVSRNPLNFKAMLESNRMDAFEVFVNENGGAYPDEKMKMTLCDRELPGIAHYILKFADESRADLIIMGPKGHSKVELLLMGSVTESTLTHSYRVPVLVVKDSAIN